MAGGKETPRQKMIGMMYLVLLALLAMNVSKEILNAFVVINDSLENTNENFQKKNDLAFAQFEKQKALDPIKTAPFFTRAKNVQQLADNLDDHITTLKKRIIAQTEKYPSVEEVPHDSIFELKNVGNKDNNDVPTQILVGAEPAAPREDEWSAFELQMMIEDFNTQIMREITALIPQEDAEKTNITLNLNPVRQPDGRMETWINGNFYHLPLAAVITNLTKIQADIKNAEAEALTLLFSKISADDFKFDKLDVKVIPNTNYLILGDSFKADVFVAALSTTQDPVLRVGKGIKVDSTGSGVIGGELDSNGVSYSEGMGQYSIKPTSEGLYEWGGIISLQKPDGSMANYAFQHEFTVAKPALVVSPTKMNVFYRGVPNPIEVSVPGIPTEKLKVTCSNGSLSKKGKGKFEVSPGKGKEAVVSVSAEVSGSNKSFGKMTFRCKNVPDPKPKFAGVSGSGRVPKRKLTAAQGVVAAMDNFEFDLKFKIISYGMSATIKGKVVSQQASSAYLTPGMKTILKSLKPNQKVYLENIKAKGPDGSIRNLGAMAITVG